MYRITIHCEADDLSLLEPIARHLGHIEVAIDAPVPEPPKQVHPVVTAVDQADRAIASLKRKAQRESAKRAEQRRTSGRIIRAVACPHCHQAIGVPCVSPNGSSYGMSGHVHSDRLAAYHASLAEPSHEPA